MADTATWRDIDVSFAVNPITGDIAVVKDIQAVLQHIRLLLSTEAYDIPFHPEIECPLPFFLFDLFSTQIADAATIIVTNILAAYDGRFTLLSLDVTFDPDRNEFKVSGKVQITSSGQVAPFEVVLERYR